MKLYAVTKGDYSDYHIITLTADKEAAKKFAKMFSDGYDVAKVEEYEDGKIILGKKLFFVRMNHGNHGNDIYYTHVLTDTAEKAEKIGKDRIMKYIAEKENL